MFFHVLDEALETKSKARAKPNVVLSESVSKMASSFSNYLCNKQPSESQTQRAQQGQLKHHEMWAHFDKLISKLNEEEVEDLNFDLSNVIRATIQKKRDRDKQSE